MDPAVVRGFDVEAARGDGEDQEGWVKDFFNYQLRKYMLEFLNPKKIERITDVRREGASTLAQISAFLGALLFSAFILIVEQRTNYNREINREIFSVFRYSHIT